MWGFLTSLIHGGDDDVTLRAAHENVPIDVRIQSTLNSVELVVEFSAVTLFCVLMYVTIEVNSVKCRFIFKTLFLRSKFLSKEIFSIVVQLEIAKWVHLQIQKKLCTLT